MSTTATVRGPEPGHSQHPTRPATPAQLDWLRTEVTDWQHEGLIGHEQAQALLGRYHPARRVSLARLLLTLGAVFVGFGLIWLVAANLEQLAPLSRFAVVAVIWTAVTVGAELLAVRRAHGGPIPSSVVQAGRLLAALLFGAVVFQAAQSLQVPAYEPRLVGVWALGALLHGYLVRAAAPVVLGVTAGLTWVVWSAVWDQPSVLGVLLAVCAAGVGAVAIAVLQDGLGTTTSAADLSWPWRTAGAVALLGALFAAALPFGEVDDVVWTARLSIAVTAAALLGLATVGVLLLRRRSGGTTPPCLLWELLGAATVTGLAVLLAVWDAGSDAGQVSLVDWAHAATAVVGYLAVSAGVAALGVLRDRAHLTVVAVVGLVLFTTFQSFAVFAQIIDGAWLFLAMGLILAGTGWLADRGRRRLAVSLRDVTPTLAATGSDPAQQGESR